MLSRKVPQKSPSRTWLATRRTGETWGGKEVSMFGKENRNITILHLPKYLSIYPLVYLTVQIDSQQNIVRQYENITGKGINVR